MRACSLARAAAARGAKGAPTARKEHQRRERSTARAARLRRCSQNCAGDPDGTCNLAGTALVRWMAARGTRSKVTMKRTIPNRRDRSEPVLSMRIGYAALLAGLPFAAQLFACAGPSKIEVPPGGRLTPGSEEAAILETPSAADRVPSAVAERAETRARPAVARPATPAPQ